VLIVTFVSWPAQRQPRPGIHVRLGRHRASGAGARDQRGPASPRAGSRARSPVSARRLRQLLARDRSSETRRLPARKTAAGDRNARRRPRARIWATAQARRWTRWVTPAGKHYSTAGLKKERPPP